MTYDPKTDPEYLAITAEARADAATGGDDPMAKFREPVKITFYRDLVLDNSDKTLVGGLVETGTLALLVGPPGSGKTFLATHLGLRVAQGAQFFGRDTVKTGVLFIATEAGSSICKRILAYEGIDKEIPFAVVTSGLVLGEGGSVGLLLEAISKAEEETGIKFGLVIIDTLARAMPGKDESSSKDMGLAVEDCGAIQAATGATVLLCHHPGKDASRGSRGSSALPGAIDTGIEMLSPKNGTYSARVEKQRDLPCEGFLSWKLEVVEVGRTPKDVPVTTCVVVPIEREPEDKPAKAPKLTDAVNIALEQLRKAINERGEPGTETGHVPAGRNVVPVELWRRYCYTAGTGSEDTKKKAFQRARDRLQALQMIGVWADQVWLVVP
jgi:hypothetical protein